MAFEPITPERAALRLKAIELRKSGAMVKDIVTQVGAPLGTVQGWLKWGEKHGYFADTKTVKSPVETKPEIVPNTVPLVVEASEVDHDHGGILGEINLERRAEIENAEQAVIDSCPCPGIIAVIEEEEGKIYSRTEQLPPAHETGDVPIETELPGPVETPVTEKKPIAAGWFLVIAMGLMALIVVLVITQRGG